jgi:hypothetical protein
MSRNYLSVGLLCLLLILAACRLEEPVVPTEAAVAAPPTLAATPIEFGTNTPTPLPVATGTATDTPPSATPTAPPPSPTASPVPPTMTAVPPTATLAPPPTATTVPPTPTRNYGPPPGGSARITFGPGATSATVQSTLVAGGDGDTWLLRVNAGQVIAAQTLSTIPGTVIVSLLDPTGAVLATNPDIVGVSAAAPVTGDYQINLATTDGAPEVAYTMQVFVPPAETAPPVRIILPTGESTTQLFDTLNVGGDINQYVLRLEANQGLSVAVFASVPAVTNIYIRDTTGRLISSGTDMSGAYATSTVAGDYFIDISSAAGAPQLSYTLTVTAPPVVPPPQPVRIEFGPGQIAASFDGQIVAGGAIPQYVVAAAAGQTIITNLNDNPPGSTAISIYDATGTLLNFGRGPASLATSVAAAGDYNLILSAETAPANYSLEVVVPPLPAPGATRIDFPAGAMSTTVSGDLAFGGDVDHWVIGAQAGQVMNLAVGTSTPGWLRLFVYNEAGQIIGLGTDISGVSAPLATNGDYRLVVVGDPAIGPVSYTMGVDIR